VTTVSYATDEFEALVTSRDFPVNPNLQELAVRQAGSAAMTDATAAGEMVARIASVLRLNPQRVARICELDDAIDRRQALKIRERRPGPGGRLPDEHIYPHAGWIGSYLAWCEHMEVPLAWHFWAGLTVLAACCRRNFYVHSGAYPIWPSLYTVLVGPSGEGKSLCLQSAAKPMIEAVNRQLKASRDMATMIDDTINLIPDRITVASFLDRAAISYTVDLGKEVDGDGKMRRPRPEKWKRKDSATMLIEDELCAFIGKDSVDAGAWISMFLRLSNGEDTYINPTQLKTRVLEGVSMTCLFGSAEENLRKGMPPTFLQGGMMGRCMWIHRLSSGRSYPSVQPLDPINREDLANWLVQLTRMEPREITRHPETEDWWYSFYENWSSAKETHPEFKSWHNRVKDQLLRVAMLLALSNGRFEIWVRDLEDAKAVIDAEQHRFGKLFGILSLTRDGETSELVLGAIPVGEWISANGIAGRLRGKIATMDQLQRALDLLVADGSVKANQQMRRSAAGRPPALIVCYRKIPGGGK